MITQIRTQRQPRQKIAGITGDAPESLGFAAAVMRAGKLRAPRRLPVADQTAAVEALADLCTSDIDTDLQTVAGLLAAHLLRKLERGQRRPAA
jgi:hypothetical protein